MAIDLKGRNLVTVDDVSNDEIEAIFSLADRMHTDIRGHSNLCKGMVMASLFYEPSTRTRLSFETAMLRLGGSVVTAVDVSTTSIAKGETLADTARVISSYVDIIVVRHPWEGAARVVADYASVPVINAGDGSHEHPTQSLCDLYTLKREKGEIRDLTVVLCGDLKNARTVHSLTYALAGFGANIMFMPSKGLELPDYVKDRLNREYMGIVTEGKGGASASFREMDAIYLTQSQLPLPDPNAKMDLAAQFSATTQAVKPNLDVVYASRTQKERQVDAQDPSPDDALRVDREFMRRPSFRDALIMHPLPRVDEIDYALDKDERSIYFKQAAYGVPVRMALLASFLGVSSPEASTHPGSFAYSLDYPPYKSEEGIRCPNPTCVSNKESTYITPEFALVDERPAVLRCRYCQRDTTAEAAGSRRTRVFHKAGFHPSRRLHVGNLVYFESFEQASNLGYRPGYRVPSQETENEQQSDPE